jgi:hypothetical protein
MLAIFIVSESLPRLRTKICTILDRLKIQQNKDAVFVNNFVNSMLRTLYCINKV